MRASTMPFTTITLDNGQGGSITFKGALYAQTSFFEEDTGVLTKQELYSTEDGHQAFALVSSDGDLKRKSAYIVRRQGDLCVMDNGERTMTLPYDWLMMFTQALWDIDLEEQRRRCAPDQAPEAALGG
ncbi:hypothetical protein [Desulfocurvus sp.]|jgi:hypothetical protein|uniref:hypothetical protein n=1 Tax=Desulfocurvus sp. TaxID=2871698 RepID=UPI0025BB5EAF|nr:hypothetical protein [Desulfocurvus sp.]MCK9240392.1 hypothetical protein [Desulfocurvus sp.]